MLNLGHSTAAPHERRRPTKGATSWTQFAKIVAFLRLAAQRPEPLVAKARSRLDLALDLPMIPSQSFSASPRPLSTIPAPLREHSLLRASPFAGQQADDDIFVQPQLLHAHAALLLDRTHRGAEHLVAGVFEYYSWMPQVAASSAWPLMHSALGSQQPPAPLLNRADAN